MNTRFRSMSSVLSRLGQLLSFGLQMIIIIRMSIIKITRSSSQVIHVSSFSYTNVRVRRSVSLPYGAKGIAIE